MSCSGDFYMYIVLVLWVRINFWVNKGEKLHLLSILGLFLWGMRVLNSFSTFILISVVYNVGTHQGNELTRNSPGNPRPQSSQLAVLLWTHLWLNMVELAHMSWSPHTRTHVHTRARARTHIQTHARTRAHTHTHTHTHTHAHARTHARTHKLTHSHARTHTCTHARTHKGREREQNKNKKRRREIIRPSLPHNPRMWVKSNCN